MVNIKLFIVCLLIMLPSQAAIENIDVRDVTIPVIIHRDYNPVMALNIQTKKRDKIRAVTVVLGKSVSRYKKISLHKANLDKEGALAVDRDGNPVDDQNPTSELGSITGDEIRKGKSVIKCEGDLDLGDNHLWLSVTLNESANIEHFVRVGVAEVRTKNTRKYALKAFAKQRIGYALTVPNFKALIQAPESTEIVQERTSKYARIPGLTRTRRGTLIAVFDNRYRHNGDLPADIDCAVRRSTDGGQTWSPVITCIAARDISGIGHGVGDPTILLDKRKNRIWVAGLAAPKTGHPIWKSEIGSASPDNCGQLILAHSDDEGETWSKPINITESVKRLGDSDTKKWALLFQGPGNGICMRDGTLVFPAQIWGHQGKGSHWGVLVYSKDNGKTWTSSKAMEFGGSESQVAELSDGSLMLNCREGIRGLRQVGVTKDMGETWEKHGSVSTEEGRLTNTFCQACLISVFNKKTRRSKGRLPYDFGEDKHKHLLFFSNPTKNRRRYMTLKYSKDDGNTWNKGLLYDQRNGMGYSAIYPIDKEYLGVFYESQGHYLQFLKVKYTDILKAE